MAWDFYTIPCNAELWRGFIGQLWGVLNPYNFVFADDWAVGCIYWGWQFSNLMKDGHIIMWDLAWVVNICVSDIQDGKLGHGMYCMREKVCQSAWTLYFTRET